MVAALLDAGGLDPTRGERRHHQRLWHQCRGWGAAEWVVVEADESDGTFLRLPATIAIVTNADPDHLDYYGTFDCHARRPSSASSRTCRSMASRCCAWTIPKCRRWWGRIIDRRIITYGFSHQADVRAVNVRFAEGVSHFDVVVTDRLKGTETKIENLRLPMPGEHNVQNVLAAITVARELGVGEDTIRSALAGFGGVNRRFTKVGEWNGLTIIDDYAHNPFKIAAALKPRARPMRGR